MDVTCTNCGEPWDWDEVRYALIYETTLDEHVKEKWDGVLTDEIRAAFKAAGYEFGERVAHLTRCESCPPETVERKRPTLREMVAEATADLLGDDTDGYLAMMEDAELMFGEDLDS